MSAPIYREPENRRSDSLPFRSGGSPELKTAVSSSGQNDRVGASESEREPSVATNGSAPGWSYKRDVSPRLMAECSEDIVNPPKTKAEYEERLRRRAADREQSRATARLRAEEYAKSQQAWRDNLLTIAAAAREAGIGYGDEDDEGDPQFGRTAAEVVASTPDEPDWLIPGLLARGWALELHAREKTGKGQFLTNLLGALENQRPTLFGPAAAEPVTALIYTEEPEDTLSQKLYDALVRRALIVEHWELARLGEWEDRWPALLDRAVGDGHGVLFIDNVSRATGTEEEAGTELARKVEPLLTAARKQGIAVIIDRHQRKSGGKPEDLARGGTALDGAVEVVVAMQRYGSWEDRRRRLFAHGRHHLTRWERLVELSEDRTEYIDAGDVGAAATDIRDAVLYEQPEWTVKEFAAATGYSDDACRDWLRSSPHTEQIAGGKRGQPLRFRVVRPDTPALD
jgi:hypothetical protein